MSKRRESDNGIRLTEADAEAVGAASAVAAPEPFPLREDLPAEPAEAAPASDVEPSRPAIVRATAEQQTAEFYELLGQGEALIAAFALQIPFQVAQEIFVFSEGEKAQLVPPTARLIEKYAPWLLESKYADEFKVVGILGWLTYAKVRAALETARRLHEQVPTPERTREGSESDSPDSPAMASTVEAAAA